MGAWSVGGAAVAAVLAAAGAGAGPPAATPTPAAGPHPMLRVEATTVDAGVVTGGETARAVFVFHNDGDRPVRILRVKPG